MVYKLANRLGGRSEVIDMPVLDALNYLIIVMEEEEREQEAKAAEMYMNYIAMVKSHPAQNGKQQEEQNQFAEMLKPKSFRQPKKVSSIEDLKRLKEIQDRQHQLN